MQHTNSRTYVCQCIWCCALTATGRVKLLHAAWLAWKQRTGRQPWAMRLRSTTQGGIKLPWWWLTKTWPRGQCLGVFPNATMHLCLFHVLRSFRRQITCEKFGITSGERDVVLDMMSRLTYARSIHDYTTTYTELLECGLESTATGIRPRTSGWKAWMARSSHWVKQPTTAWKARTRR